MTKKELFGVRYERAKDENEASRLVTAIKLPTGAVEIAINTDRIEEKVAYILNAYNDDLQLKAAPRQEGDEPIRIVSYMFA